MVMSLITKKRGRLEICMDILDAVSDFRIHLRSPVMYHTNITHNSFKFYLSHLVLKKMVEVLPGKRRPVKITMLGYETLRRYKRIQEKLV